MSGSTTPNTNSYTGQDTLVALTGVPASSASMTVGVRVRAAVIKRKELAKEIVKEAVKDGKEVEIKQVLKERKELIKEGGKEFKEFKEFKEAAKDGKEFERPPDWRLNAATSALGTSSGNALADALALLDHAVGLVHGVVDAQNAASAGPFIDASLRPDLYGGPVYQDGAGELDKRMAEGDAGAKRAFDSPPQR